MREKTGDKFLDDLFEFLMDMLDSGSEVHIVDKSDPDNVTEHVFTSDEDEEEIPFTDGCPDNHTECDDCKYFDECFADEIYDDGYEIEVTPNMYGIPEIERIVFSGPATIVFWEDNTKTVVKAMKGEKIEHYAGFAAACMKKMFGSTSHAKAVMNELAVEQVIVDKGSKELVPMTEEQQVAHDVAIQEAIDEALG